jgi:hypothetical protein
MTGSNDEDPHATHLQYAGIGGSTADCMTAIERLVMTEPGVKSAVILTDRKKVPDHALLLTLSNGDQVIIKSGFASGYGGTGPKGLSATLALLDWHGVELSEIEIDKSLMERLDASALTTKDVETIAAARPAQPARLWEYILEPDMNPRANPWRNRDLVIPMALIDDRLAETARDFWSDPDGLLFKAHRQLEGIISKKAGLTLEEAGEGPAAVLKKAFNGKDRRLGWPGITESEHAGRVNIFFGTMTAYRHVRAHRSDDGDPADQLGELLLLNQLYRLEATTRVQNVPATTKP